VSAQGSHRVLRLRPQPPRRLGPARPAARAPLV